MGRKRPERRPGAAVDRLEELLQDSKAEAQVHSQRGAKLHKDGDLASAIAEYDKAVELYPRYPEVYYNRGLAHRKMDEMAAALADYTQAIRLDPKYVPAYANRGYAYYMLKDYHNALADFDRILELDPNNTDAKKSRRDHPPGPGPRKSVKSHEQQDAAISRVGPFVRGTLRWDIPFASSAGNFGVTFRCYAYTFLVFRFPPAIGDDSLDRHGRRFERQGDLAGR